MKIFPIRSFKNYKAKSPRLDGVATRLVRPGRRFRRLTPIAIATGTPLLYGIKLFESSAKRLCEAQKRDACRTFNPPILPG
jgi:hypothetical protein